MRWTRRLGIWRLWRRRGFWRRRGGDQRGRTVRFVLVSFVNEGQAGELTSRTAILLLSVILPAFSVVIDGKVINWWRGKAIGEW